MNRNNNIRRIQQQDRRWVDNILLRPNGSRSLQKILQRTASNAESVKTINVQTYIGANSESFINDLGNAINTDGILPSFYGLLVTLNASNNYIETRLRISNHPSVQFEWMKHENGGFPDARFSIYILDEKDGRNKTITDTEAVWHPVSYSLEHGTVYERGFPSAVMQNAGMLQSIINDVCTIIENGTIGIKENNNQIKYKNTMNKIRLTESQLHRVIKESVNRILTELDWKTYANAARKRAAQNPNYGGRPNFMDPLTMAARAAYNRDYGYNNSDSEYERYYDGAIDPVSNHYSSFGIENNKQYRTKKPEWEMSRNLKDAYSENDGLSPYPHDWGLEDAYRKGTKEMEDYKNGNYYYQKGKGWQLR